MVKFEGLVREGDGFLIGGFLIWLEIFIFDFVIAVVRETMEYFDFVV